jgi:biopolymer transport protein ExbD
MARRKISEINAGSMADIAFLLLIFFLVTTTMEVDAGIGRQLPLKLDDQVVNPPVPINKRNVLEIMTNADDQLLVEGNWIEIDELYDIVVDFYTVNKNMPDQDVNMPNFSLVNINTCNTEIKILNKAIAENSNIQLKTELNRWKTKLAICRSLEEGYYMEMNKQSIIQLKSQGETSYGLYIEIHNILKQVVNELRVAECERLGFPNYYELREERPADQEYIAKLRVLVPERIIEPKINH